MSQENDCHRKLPTLAIGFDADHQGVILKFDNAEFKSWDFVLAVLEMARGKAEDSKRMAQVQAMQAQAQERALMGNIRLK